MSYNYFREQYFFKAFRRKSKKSSKDVWQKSRFLVSLYWVVFHTNNKKDDAYRVTWHNPVWWGRIIEDPTAETVGSFVGMPLELLAEATFDTSEDNTPEEDEDEDKETFNFENSPEYFEKKANLEFDFTEGSIDKASHVLLRYGSEGEFDVGKFPVLFQKRRRRLRFYKTILPIFLVSIRQIFDDKVMYMHSTEHLGFLKYGQEFHVGYTFQGFSTTQWFDDFNEPFGYINKIKTSIPVSGSELGDWSLFFEDSRDDKIMQFYTQKFNKYCEYSYGPICPQEYNEEDPLAIKKKKND